MLVRTLPRRVGKAVSSRHVVCNVDARRKKEQMKKGKRRKKEKKSPMDFCDLATRGAPFEQASHHHTPSTSSLFLLLLDLLAAHALHIAIPSFDTAIVRQSRTHIITTFPLTLEKAEFPRFRRGRESRLAVLARAAAVSRTWTPYIAAWD